MAEAPRFLFVTCQIGAEQALKGELARSRPDWLPAYARPGFVTFKLPAEHGLSPGLRLDVVFAQSCHLSLGRATGDDPDALARSVWDLLGDRPCQRIHVWQRRVSRGEKVPGTFCRNGPEGASHKKSLAASPGAEKVPGTFCRNGPEGASHKRSLAPFPGEDDEEERALAPEAVRARGAIVRHCPRPNFPAEDAADPGRPASSGQLVLDCIVVQSGEWWVGYHRARSVPSRWPGGLIPLVLPEHAVSLAWLKMEEALVWSGLPVRPGARCVEIGSAPGGASQALLDRGLIVMGIDPAEMAPPVLGHPHFTHVRRRSTQVRRREFRKARWLTADMNVAPNYTLSAVEDIVTHREVSIRGLLLTLKLPQWTLAERIPEWLERIAGWDYNFVRARQLRYNRQEVCVAALQKPFRRKPFRPRWRS